MLIMYSALPTQEDRDQFEKLYLELRQPLFRQAMSILHDTHEAEDAVEDTFTALAESFPKISGMERQKMRAYIVIINRNKAIDRYNKRRGQLSRREDADPEDLSVDTDFDRFDREELYSAIKRLPQKYKDIVYLYELLELPAEDIGRSLGISADGVYKRASRARAMLRKLLEEGENND